MTRSTLMIYNTVDRLLRGDMFHTVTVNHVKADLAAYPADWPVVGIGTTNWQGRNGEIILDGAAGDLHFWWTDPDSDPAGVLVDLAREQPDTASGTTPLVTPKVGDDDRVPSFPFLAVALCNPASAFTWEIGDVESIHSVITEALRERNVGVAAIQARGQFSAVKTSDAYNLPITGLNLTQGYVGDDYFRIVEHGAGDWVMNGVYAANPSMQPFISLSGHPLHLHGFSDQVCIGGHLLVGAAMNATVRVWPLDDFVMKIYDVARAMNPVKESGQ